MTIQEAKIILNSEEHDSIEEALEWKLFEFKQFFTSKVIIPSVFLGRIKKIEQIQLAAITLGFNSIPKEVSWSFILKKHQDIEQTVLEFQSTKNKLYLAIHSCTSIQELKSYTLALLDIFIEFASLWPEIPNYPQDIILSKPIDELLLLENIRNLKKIGISNFDQLSQSIGKEYNFVLEHSQRLHLIHKKHKNGRTT